MSILSSIKSLFIKEDKPNEIKELAKSAEPTKKGFDWNSLFSNFENNPYTGDRFSDELLRTLNDCGRLLNEENPKSYVSFSNLIFRIFPLYKKAIRLRTIFVGTLKITNTSNNQNATKIDAVIKYINEEIPIYDSGSMLVKSYGINSLLNMVSEDCDKSGMAFVQVSYDNRGAANGIYIYKPSLFSFGYDSKGVSHLYYENDTIVDINSIYLFCYQSIRGYDWGAPLLYGNKFLTDSVIKLINAQMQGLMRNMNPFDLTILSTDLKQLEEYPDKQKEVFEAMKKLKEDIEFASRKALKGESAHVVSNIAALSSATTSRSASTITFMDSKTFGTLIELLCAGLDVPYQLLMNVSGSMNTDQTSNGLLLMEAWASEFSRPQLLPVFKKMIKGIFLSHNIPLGSDEIEVVFVRNETMLASLNALNTPPQNNTPTPNFVD